MSFTLLHTADLHLGKSFRELPPEIAGARRADLVEALQRLCALVQVREADALVIAGDLFDRAVPPPGLLAQVKLHLAAAKVPVVLIPGNHDPLEAGSPYLDPHWPANVIVAREAGWQRLDWAGPETWAFGYTTVDAHHGAWTAFPGCAPDALLLLHAACLAPGMANDAEGYYRFAPKEIPPCAYLALGHYHRPASVAATPPACYPGSPEALEAQEVDAEALLVTLDGASATAEPVSVAIRRHRLVTLDVTGLALDAILQRAQAGVQREDLITLTLTGILEPDVPLNTDELAASLGAYHVKVDDRGLLLPLGEEAEAGGVMGVLREIAAAELAALPADDPQRTRYARAARLARLALEGRLK
jgi:DNA repair exonuclease SbcCD nuclease subunit